MTHEPAGPARSSRASRRPGATLLGAALLVAAAAGPQQAAPAHAAADVEDAYRARYHFTVPDHWKNDPQRPVVIDGTTHYYYLYNADYDDAVGTAWRLATTTDNVVFHDQGVAAPKGTNANYDLWSGSAVVDTAGTAGFGAGAVIMLVTQMDHPTPAQILDASGPQAQFLWYSTDGGRTFQPHGEQPVIPNGGRRDFRDPKVVWDPDRGRWVALIAEGQRIGFWTSPNLRDWTRVSEYVNTGLGILECPDLFQIRADDGTLRWVMGLSGNGYLTGAPSTYAYWTGAFDGTTFVPDSPDPQWLDHGFDWYGAVTWPDPSSTGHERRFAVGWMNNWSYPYTTPTWAADGFNGTDSIVREIRLARTGSGYSLLSQPVAALDTLATSVTELGTLRVDGHHVLDHHGDAYQLETDISWSDLDNVGLQVRRSADGTRHADVGVFGDVSYLNRGGTGNPDPTGDKWESHAPFDPSADRVHLRILVDRTTVEVFVDDGRYVHSSQVFADPDDTGIALYSSGGTATFSNLTITTLDAPDQRPAHVLADFEGADWGPGWTATGAFADAGPTASTLRGQVGRQVLDTFGGGDPATGTITSPPFTIDRRYLHVLVAGGSHPLGVEPATAVSLLVDGRPVRTATGDDTGALRPVRWDVEDLAGRQAQVQVLDDATGAWGHLMIDQVVLSD